MPWKDVPLETQRQQFCYRVLQAGEPVSAVCRQIGISRKTGYKWLKRYRDDPRSPLADRSRRPLASPGRTPEAVERKILFMRDAHRWGGRKINRLLLDASEPVPSIRTVSAILRRHGRTHKAPTLSPEASPVLFERGRPNELWQLDHKGPCEIARRRHHPFTVLDDHSRFCFCFEPLADKSIGLCWPVLWEVFGTFGLPEAILCDNAFSAWGLGLSEFDMRLIRLGIRPVHGRPYHPQTQGKVERLHGTIDYELLTFKARMDRMDHFLQDRDRWQHVYNHLRPHESLGDHPPISRWSLSPRKRPDRLPPVEYDAGAILRKVSQVGDIHYRGARIGVARSLAGQHLRIEERENEVGIFYSWKQLRTIPKENLKTRHHNERI